MILPRLKSHQTWRGQIKARQISFILIHICLIALLVSTVKADQKKPVIEPSSYRKNNYNATVPLTLKGAKIIDSPQQLFHFLREHKDVTLIDAYPAANKPKGLVSTELWIEPDRQTLPKALWLANIGMGDLPEELEELLKRQLKQISAENKNSKIVIFCEPDCWHSWNAAKRAVSFGYTNVYWYRQGVSAWEEAGYETETKQPIRP